MTFPLCSDDSAAAGAPLRGSAEEGGKQDEDQCFGSSTGYDGKYN